MSAELRTLHLVGALGAVRTELWKGEEHLVVPVIMLREAAIHAINAKNREFVPLSALEASAGKWNGHPLVIGHPVRDGKQISANDPAVLEQHGFGFIRGAHIKNRVLAGEAMCNVKRLEKLNPALLADLRAAKGCELSVGAFVTTDEEAGTYEGREYKGKWLEIGPDHLAFLPGGVGACSIAMGCGAHRAAASGESEEELRDLGGPGSGWFAEAGHASDTANLHDSVASHKAAASAHFAASNAHDVAFEKTGEDYHQNAARDHREKQSEHNIRAKEKNSTRNVGRFGSEGERMSLKDRFLALFKEGSKPEEVTEEEIRAALGDEEDDLGAFEEDLRTLIGARNSKTDLEKIQMMHDHAADLGATCAAGNTHFMRAAGDVVGHEFHGNQWTTNSDGSEMSAGQASARAIRLSDAASSGGLSHHHFLAVKAHRIAAALFAPKDSSSSKQHTEWANSHAETGMRLRQKERAQRAKGEISFPERPLHFYGLSGATKTQDCEACDGTGQVKDGESQKDCPSCNGTGEVAIKAAEAVELEGSNAAKGEVHMTAEQKAKALKALAACGCNKTFETDEQIFEALAEAAEKAQADKATTAAKLTTAEGKITALEAAQIPAEELTTLRALGEERKAKDAAEKAGLVTKLEALKTLSKEQLEARSLDDLRTMAAFAKIETVDYSGQGLPVHRAAATTDEPDYTAPDPYAKPIKALQGVTQ